MFRCGNHYIKTDALAYLLLRLINSAVKQDDLVVVVKEREYTHARLSDKRRDEASFTRGKGRHRRQTWRKGKPAPTFSV